MAAQDIRKSETLPWDGFRKPIKVLAFSQSPEDLTDLRIIARAADWELLTVHSTQSGLVLLQKHPIQVAICDRDRPGTDWRTLLSKIAELKKPVNALLASRITSDHLWREVLQYYGYDLIKQPFEKQSVRRIVTRAAWTSYDFRG
jgi:DNA-binding NtrC family response regulator